MTAMTDLSVLIPARGEEFLDRTIQDVLEKIEGETEIIAVLDGYTPEPPLKQIDPRITLIYLPISRGQRAATNLAAKIAKGKYLMKIDAHCAFDQGFDVKMMADMQDDWTLVPTMKNLHAFDWICPNGHRRYQSPSGVCTECGKETTKDIVWIAKNNPTSTTYRFDKTMHFQYWSELGKMQQGDLIESMSIQGSCFMCTKEKYFELDLCGEEFNSWGQQGVEVACKTWLSGGKVMVTRKTWYAHMFRTQGGDFGFPYENPQSKVNENRELSRQLFKGDTWPKAKHKFQWLLDKFNPPEWGITKGIIYYTDGKLDENIAKPVINQLVKCAREKNIPIVTATLGHKLDFGVKNVCFPSLKRGYLTMFKQILGALENSTADIIFFCEHDVFYHPSHFDFTPEDKETFYYNQNVWLLRTTDGHCLHYDVNQLSGLCVYRDAAITHFKERIALVEKEGFTRNMGFEPFTHGRVPWVNQFKLGTWKSAQPNVDIKHGANATGQRWRKEEYRNQQLLVNWTEAEEIPGWGEGKSLL
jgi:glycosyltransferase involved in cell wall biosynthesis